MKIPLSLCTAHTMLPNQTSCLPIPHTPFSTQALNFQLSPMQSSSQTQQPWSYSLGSIPVF